MKTKHTLGPWSEEKTVLHYLIMAGDVRVATAEYQGDERAYARAQGYANARLIAIAPDLLEALEKRLILSPISEAVTNHLGMLKCWKKPVQLSPKQPGKKPYNQTRRGIAPVRCRGCSDAFVRHAQETQV